MIIETGEKNTAHQNMLQVVSRVLVDNTELLTPLAGAANTWSQ